MKEKFKKGDRVKIGMHSQAAIEVFRNDKKREKWENAGRIGFVTEITKAPAGNVLVRVGVYPGDPKGDYFFSGDLKSN